MAGKVSKKVKKLGLTRFWGTEDTPGFQERVERLKNLLTSKAPEWVAEREEKGITRLDRTPAALSDRWADLRAEKDRLEEEEKAVNLALEAVRQLIIQTYDEEGMDSLRLHDGRSVSVQVEPYAQVKDADAFRQWCIKEGLQRKMTLPWPTTNQLTKERLFDGLPEPPGIKAFQKEKLVLRKGG